jgi:hypothetical protein
MSKGSSARSARAGFLTKGAVYMCMSSSELDRLQKAFRDAGGKWSTDIHLWYMGAMAKTPETQLIEALKKVDVYGDIAPPYVQDPMTMVLRQNAIQADLIRWDDSRGRFVLTGTGRNRITARGRTSGKILHFKMRDKNRRAPLRKA